MFLVFIFDSILGALSQVAWSFEFGIGMRLLFIFFFFFFLCRFIMRQTGKKEELLSGTVNLAGGAGIKKIHKR